MDSDRLLELFSEAVARRTPAEREAYGAEACGGDAEVRRQVNALLAAHEQAGDFLPTRATIVVEPAGEAPHDVIGRYKLLELIGEGGFGRVYMAEQLRPIRRKVALKIIKLGMDTREVIGRFEAERQALALMDHPNIAQVFDAGATPTGRPYFVMELVKGIPITDYCDQEKLPTAERLELFIKVCHAVQHAHQKGVIHRDLKPSNILVTLHDGEAVPKVIDFGVAKAIGQELTTKTLFTRFTRMIGTPAYMSPEQAALSGLDVDTRSDIYSLGVLLYELLTGTTPLEHETLREAALDEIQRLIRETEPPKPSTRLQTLGERRSEIAKRRQVESAQLGRLLRGDLDWIVMKALEKDRRRRYETANGFALDLERHLTDQPVEASPPSMAYRLGKFVRRHRTGVATGLLMVLALAVGLSLAFAQFVETRKERDRARAAERRAEDEASTARLAVDMTRAVNDFLLKDLLGQASPGQSPDRNLTLRAALDRAAENVGERFKTNAELEASIRQTLGNTYRALGEYATGEQHLRRDYDICRQELGPDHESTIHAQIYLTLALIEQAREDRAKAAEAEKMLKAVLETSRRNLGPQHLDTRGILENLARLCFETDRSAEGLRLCEQILELHRQAADTNTDHTLNTRDLLAAAYLELGRPAEAEPLQRAVLERERERAGPDKPNTLATLENLGCTLETLGRQAEAELMFREVVEGRRRVLGSNHPSTIIGIRSLAFVHAGLAEWKPALEQNRELIRLQPQNFGNWYSSAVIAQLAGDTNGAQELLAGMIERFGAATDPALGMAFASDCLTLPDLAQDLAPALRFADEAFADKPGGFDQQTLKGMAELRRGRYAEAVRGLESPARHGLIHQACKAGFGLALAQHGLGDTNGARAALEGASRRFDAVLRVGVLECAIPGQTSRWRSYGPCALLRAEAERGILGRETSPPLTADLLARHRAQWDPVRRALIEAGQLAGQCRWSAARDAYMRALAMPGFDWDTAEAMDQEMPLQVGVVLLRAGDTANHEKLCRALFARLDAASPPLQSALTALLYLLKENGRSPELTQRALETARGAEEPVMDFGVRFFLRLAAGLGDYRQGQYQEALEPLREAAKYDLLGCSVPAQAYLALAQHRLGRKDEVEETLSAAERTLAPFLKRRAEDWRFWWNTDLCTLAFDEAHQVVRRGAHATKP